MRTVPHHLPMHDNPWPVSCVALPGESRVAHFYATMDLADAYAIRLPTNTITDPELLARFVLSQQAPWVAVLLHLRDTLVAGFGIKTARQLKSPAGSFNDWLGMASSPCRCCRGRGRPGGRQGP